MPQSEQSERLKPARRTSPGEAGGHARAVTLEIILLLVIPTLIFTFGALPPLWRYSVMEVALAVVLVLVIRRRVPLAQLGLRRDNFRAAVKLLAPGTMTIVGLVVLAYTYGFGTSLEMPSVWWNTQFFVYYWLIAVLSQQFAFVGYGVTRFQSLKFSPWAISAIIGVLFSFLHSHHVSPSLWVGTFLLGFYWAWYYQKEPNLYAVALSHLLIGTVTIMLGFV